MHASEPSAPANVWIFQPTVEHYRAPIFDAVRVLADGRYDLQIFGPLVDGAGTGGVRRPWFNHQPYVTRAVAGQTVSWWPGAEARVSRGQPDVLIVGASPRCLSAWRLPSVCRKVGTVPVCWSKVHSFSGLPGFVTGASKWGLYRQYARAIVYGDASRAELMQLGFAEDRIHVAHNTIDTDRIFTDGDAIAARGQRLLEEAGLEGRKAIVCVGRMFTDKRQGDLLAAWPALKAIDPTLALVLVGGGPDLELRRSQAQVLDPEGRDIIVTGRVPEGDDYAWLSAAHMAIFPGAVGLSINQSMAFGTPTIIADERGADAEIVRHEETGWRYRRGDVPALVDVVARVCADDEGRQRVSARGRQLMRDDITLDQMARALDSAISAALAQR
ncbi:MAG: glycosyltransferase family 4 protein [Bradymonadia bacterium]